MKFSSDLKTKKIAAAMVVMVSIVFFSGPGSSLFAQSIAKIEISPRVHSLNPCEEKKFGLNAKNSSGKQVKGAVVEWESTDPKVATVNKDGVVVGVNPGYTFITARNGKVKSNVSSVFVREKGTRRC